MATIPRRLANRINSVIVAWAFIRRSPFSLEVLPNVQSYYEICVRDPSLKNAYPVQIGCFEKRWDRPPGLRRAPDKYKASTSFLRRGQYHKQQSKSGVFAQTLSTM